MHNKYYRSLIKSGVDYPYDIFVGGNYSSYKDVGLLGNVSTGRIVKIDSDGNQDLSFDTGESTGLIYEDRASLGGLAGMAVRASKIDSNGAIYFGGDFTSYGRDGSSLTRNRIIRLLSNGSIDRPDFFSPDNFNTGTGFDAIVRVIEIDNSGRILVGGDFTTYNGAPSGTYNRIIRLNTNGTVDNTFTIATGFDGIVRDIKLDSNNKIYVCGDFTTYQSLTNNRIIRLNDDGSKDISFDNATGFAGGNVNKISIDSNGKIYVVGNFTSYKSVTNNRIIRLNDDGSKDTNFDNTTGFTTEVLTVLAVSDKVYVGGLFILYKSVTNNRIIRLNDDGSKDNDFNIGTGFNNNVRDLKLNSNRLYVCGDFTSYNDVSCGEMVKLNLDGSLDTTFQSMFTNVANTLVAVITMSIDNLNNIYVGGTFLFYRNNQRIIKLDKNANSLVNVTKKGFNGTLWKIKKDSLNRLVIAGAFNTYNGVTRNRLIRLDENLEIDNTLSIGTGFNAAARTVLEQTDGKVIVGGEFTTYNGAPSGTYNRIIRLNSDGSVDGGFTIGTGFNALILSLGLQSDGKIICGGQFTTYNGNSAGRIVRLNVDGTIDNTFNMGVGFDSSLVWDIIVDENDKIYVGGSFTTYDGESSVGVIRLNSDGTGDPTFNVGTGFFGNVFTLSLFNNKLICGGQFTSYNGVTSNNIIRLNSDGSVDINLSGSRGFGASPIKADERVYAVLTTPDGKIYAGGGFSRYTDINDVTNYPSGVVRLNADFSIDNLFNVVQGFVHSGANSQVYTLMDF
jgi:uncharacterized delta-60 repeat protein